MVNIGSNTTCHTWVLKEANWRLHTCAEDVQITCTANSNGKLVHNVLITTISEYTFDKMTPECEKDYRASDITTFILSMAQTTSTCDDRGSGLPGFLPLARTGHRDSIWLLDHLWQWKTSLSRLMVACQHVGEKMTWGLSIKDCRLRFDLQKAVVANYVKAAMTHSNANIYSPGSVTSNVPHNPLRPFDINTRLTILPTSQPYQF
jgi:hypothetical protein